VAKLLTASGFKPETFPRNAGCTIYLSYADFKFKKMHKKRASHFGKTLLVTASGFKPETFSSVVRCSIQLSYAAIPRFSECKDRELVLFLQILFEFMLAGMLKIYKMANKQTYPVYL
jgi:hypothetical protein